MHGALHLVNEPEKKISLDEEDQHKNRTLTEKVSTTWKRGRRPLFISEGLSEKKRKMISKSDYLRHAFGEFRKLIENRDLVIFGTSLSDQDSHIINAIVESKAKRVCVALHQPEIDTVRKIASWRQKFGDLELIFFDAKSPECWIY
jgi:hypothetical protein